MAITATKLQLSGLAKSLVKEGLLTESDAHLHLDSALQKKKKKPIS
jgi:type IV pilus assembly protein PilB